MLLHILNCLLFNWHMYRAPINEIYDILFVDNEIHTLSYFNLSAIKKLLKSFTKSHYLRTMVYR